MEIIKTEVLVIGGGGAGLQAALAAKEKGADVLLASKTPMGKSTCTYMSGGAFSVAAEGFSKEEHQQSTLQSGKEINDRELVQVLVEEAPERIKELERFGLIGKWHKGRFNCLGKPPAWGAPLTNVLAEMVAKKGIYLWPWVMVDELLAEEGRVVGALGYNFRKGEAVAFAAKAIILASGGGGALYQRHDNPVRTTGDGYILAFQAGCQLRDMEFVQFIPCGLAEAGKPTILIAPILCDAGRIVNSAAEDILKKYRITEKPVAVRARDSFSLAIFTEEKEGREVFLDLRSLAEEDWPRDNMAWSQREFLQKNLSCSQSPLRISPMCHHFMGGIATDAHGRTEVPGLFAAGEVVGGVHGANRMGGNALAEILVFGYRAGGAAAEWAKTQGENQGGQPFIHERLRVFGAGKGSSTKGLPPKILKKMMGEILWKEGGILRTQEGLLKALESLQRMHRENLPQIKTETPKENLERMELDKAILVGEMIIRSALMREESRGAHFRKDFPQADDQKWKGNIFLRKAGESMELEFRPLK